MGPIDEACERVLRNVDGALVCGVVDLSSGIVLGGAGVSANEASLNDALAAVTSEFFLNEDMAALHAIWASPAEGEAYNRQVVEEVDVATARAHHFARSIKGGSSALLLVTDRSANIGMGWAQIRSALPEVEPHVP